jgi:hypothetical protein
MLIFSYFAFRYSLKLKEDFIKKLDENTGYFVVVYFIF